MPDYILNGQAHGSVASTLLANKLDQNIMRPFVGNDGRSWITIPKLDHYGRQVKNDKGQLVFHSVPTQNAVATLRRDDWIMIDRAVVAAARPRLRAVADVRAAGLTQSIPNGMGKTVIEYQTMGDMTPATISMDALRESENDRVEFDTRLLPLPIIHKDFHLTLRQIEVSRTGGSPLDTTQAEICGRKVAEEAEKLLIGASNSYSYGGGTVYGYKNHPNRNTKTLTAPTSINHATTLAELLDMRQKLMDDGFFGPYVLYTAPSWASWLDDDYSPDKGDNTLRERIRKLEGISDIRTLDYLTGKEMILVQLTSDVVREVVGMDVVTIQWETNGGMRVNFKVMAILVPQLRFDATGGMGLCHAS